LVLLVLWLGMPSLPALQLLSSNQLVFVNVDHAPMGACSTFAYGYKGQITISWPSAYVGWILQTNTVGLSSPAAWGDVPDSTTRSQMSFPASGAPPSFSACDIHESDHETSKETKWNHGWTRSGTAATEDG
jgi:hypothetical protein